MKSCRPKDADEMLQKALSFKPFFADVHNNLRNAFKSLGWLKYKKLLSYQIHGLERYR